MNKLYSKIIVASGILLLLITLTMGVIFALQGKVSYNRSMAVSDAEIERTSIPFDQPSYQSEVVETQRFMAYNPQEITEAQTAGCIQDGTVGQITTLECPQEASADLSLSEGTRVIAKTRLEISRAKSKGCVVALSDPDFAALECPSQVAESLGLSEDTKVYLTDTFSNGQVGANFAHNFGITGKGVKVAILDTGIDYNHPELKSSYIGGYDYVDNDNDPMDRKGHGTHVAGIIAGDGIDLRAKGVAPDAQILAYKVLNDKGHGSVFGWGTTVAKAILAANDSGAQVISMSFGNSHKRSSVTCDSYDLLLTSVIKYVTQRGSNVVISAGNEGEKVSWPACIGDAIAVGAVDFQDNVANFSGRGGALDITAPGVAILSSLPNGRYAVYSGTSMATPMVSGAIALIRSVHPEYSSKQVEDLLFSTTKDLGAPGKDVSYGWGRIDAAKALGVADNVPPVIRLIGDATKNLTVGQVYLEFGAVVVDDGAYRACDQIGGDIVDTSTPGTYNVTYDAQDATGNRAIQVIRTVIVSEQSIVCDNGFHAVDYECVPDNPPDDFIIEYPEPSRELD